MKDLCLNYVKELAIKTGAGTSSFEWTDPDGGKYSLTYKAPRKDGKV